LWLISGCDEGVLSFIKEELSHDEIPPTNDEAKINKVEFNWIISSFYVI